MSAHRVARVVVIISAAVVPVLSAVEGAPRWLLGLLGAIAAATESLSQLFRWRDSAIAAEKLGNQMESQLNLYVTGTAPYDDDETAGSLFVRRTESLRDTGTNAFVGLWAEDRPPVGQGGPLTPVPSTASPQSV